MFQSIHRMYLLILPHHPSQYDVTDDVYFTILSTLPVVYKSGFLGTKSPRLDFFCILRYSVNRSPPRRNSIPHLFHSKLSSQRHCVLGGATRHQKLRSRSSRLLLRTRTQNQTPCHVPSRSTYPTLGERPYRDVTFSSEILHLRVTPSLIVHFPH